MEKLLNISNGYFARHKEALARQVEEIASMKIEHTNLAEEFEKLKEGLQVQPVDVE